MLEILFVALMGVISSIVFAVSLGNLSYAEKKKNKVDSALYKMKNEDQRYQPSSKELLNESLQYAKGKEKLDLFEVNLRIADSLKNKEKAIKNKYGRIEHKSDKIGSLNIYESKSSLKDKLKDVFNFKKKKYI
jgi:lipopolysaccharide export LptBFGC system permease protein LptF